MVVRFRKKNSRMRGSKTHGWGSKKKHRGAGSRGGRGNAGMLKHKKSMLLRYDPDYLSNIDHKGFKVPGKTKEDIRSITLKDIDMIAKKINKTEIDVSQLGYGKVLSTGKLTQALTIKAKKIVEKAKKKIEEAGGKAVENV
ncbi:MAG: uL15 family ribosomal protein [Candidatus Aenigmatarchaeota archaeon]